MLQAVSNNLTSGLLKFCVCRELSNTKFLLELEGAEWKLRHSGGEKGKARCNSGAGPGTLILYFAVQVAAFLLLLGTKLLLGVRSFLVCSGASATSKLLRCVGCGVMYLRSPEQLGLVVILLKPSCLVVVHDLTGGVVNSVTVNC